MERILNISRLRAAMDRRGLNQAQLAAAVGVTRAATTKWLNGQDVPRPDKLLKIGLVLGLGFRDLIKETPDAMQPVVAFRRKGRRKTTPEHLDRARHMGTLLRRLVPHLPFGTLERPPSLREPQTDYGYLQQVARAIRTKLGLSQESPIQFRDLIGEFNRLHAVIIPVLWGDKSHHENALHIHLPDSTTTWIYLNLDSNVYDFNFWMAHELGHVYAPTLTEDEGEDFADAFAQALLFPEECAARAHAEVGRARGRGGRVNAIKRMAQAHCISPTTVNLALKQYALAHALTPVDAGNDIHAAATNFNKEFPSVSDAFFPQKPPSAKDYLGVVRDQFESPFFDALGALVRASDVNVGFVETVLQLPLRDAREILRELR